MLRIGASIQELLDRVPVEFAEWVNSQVSGMRDGHARLIEGARHRFAAIAPLALSSRKDFAMAVRTDQNPSLLFSLLDEKDITDAVWKLVEPKWATPFRKDIDA